MINISFSDSLTGSLKMADYYAKQENSEIQDLKENLHSIYMNLSMGNISFDELGVERRKEFANLYGRWIDFFYRAEWFDDTVKVISNLESIAKSGEEIRIWYSEYPDELCAFCWMLCLLDSWGIENEKIFYVKLPNSIHFKNGEYTTYFNTGAFDPKELVQLVYSQRMLTDAYKKAHIRQWKRAKEENTRLRTVIMGEIVSVDEDFYDSVIKIEVQKLGDIFKEAELLGNSLCKLCVSDSFIAWRIDEMIDEGLFEIVEEAKFDYPYYCRLLKNIERAEENDEDDNKIIEVYDAYIDERVHEPGTFWDSFQGILYDANHKAKYTPEIGDFLDATNGIAYHVKQKNWIVLETGKNFITLGYDGINTYPKDSEFFDSMDYMEPCVEIDNYEEFDEYKRTLFLGERIKDTYEKDGHYFVIFDNFSVEIIPLEDNEEVPWYNWKNFISYKYLYGCERLITEKCKCGGMGKLLLKSNYSYTVRCENCKRATEETHIALDAIKAWETGDNPNDLTDIIIE